MSNVVPQEPSWKILMVDDDREDYLLARDLLQRARRGKHSLTWVGTYEEGLETLRNGSFDAALIDYQLELHSGVELIREAARQGIRVPCILFTSYGGYNVDLEAMSVGAYDYLDKGDVTPSSLERALRYAISRAHSERRMEKLLEQNRRQQDLLQAIFDIDPGGVAVVVEEGADLVFVLANRAYRSILPHPEMDPVGMKFNEVWRLSEGFAGQALIQGALRQPGMLVHENLRREYPGGQVRYITLHAQPLEWEGKPGLLLVVWEFTNQEQARQALVQSEQQLRESEERYRHLIEVSPDAIFLHSGGVYRYLNQAGMRLYGAEEPEQILGKSVLERIHPDDRAMVAERMRLLTEQRCPVPMVKERLLRLDGSEFYVEALGTPFEVDGEPGALIILHDITERTKAENELRLSEERFRLASKAVRGVVFDWDVLTQTIYYSEGVREVLGFSREEIGPDPNWWFERVHPEDLPRLNQIFADLYTDPKKNYYNAEYRIRHRDGRWLEVSENGYVLRGEQGGIQRVVGTTVDISRQKEVEREIRERERRERARAAEMQALMDAVPAIIWVARDPDSRVIDGNLLASKFLRMQPGQNLSKTAPDSEVTGHFYIEVEGQVIPPADLPVQRAARGEVIQDYEFDVHFDDGEVRHLLGNATPLFDEDGQPAGSVSAFIDTTELKHVEQEVRGLESERLQNMAHIEVQRRLIEQREQERLQIARDLHDGPLQDLIGLSYALGNIQNETKDTPLEKSVLEAKELLQQQIAELRSFASALRPPLLVSFGLEKAIRGHIKEFQQRHPEIEIAFDAEQHGDLVESNVRLALYRIYQELMNNVVKHAAASQVRVLFYKTDEEAQLEVRDNGQGFNVPSDWVTLARQKHLGLVGIQERAEAVGGRVEISSKPGEGTAVRVIVPVGETSDEG